MAKKKAEKKTATKKKAAKKKTAKRRKKAEAGSRGLTPAELRPGEPPAEVAALAEQVASDGGSVIAAYPDPLGGSWQLLVGLPAEKVIPAPFQRDLSDTHVKKLVGVIDRLDRFLDPVIVVRSPEGEYWTPNGHHRSAAMKTLGARTIVALLIPEFELAYQILALNTEKAPGLKERALEVIRLARALADLAPANEDDYAIPFDEANLLTLGCCYDEKASFSGSVYQPILKRCDEFLASPLSETLETRKARGAQLLAIDAVVAEKVKELKERGAQGSYLRNFVVAQINPIAKGSRGKVDWDETLAGLEAKAAAFDAAAVDLNAIG